MNWKQNWPIWVALGLALGASCTWIGIRFGVGIKGDELGTIGDFFGGVLNPLFGLITIFLLVWSLRTQGEELKASREELALTRLEMANSTKALEDQAKTLEIQTKGIAVQAAQTKSAENVATIANLLDAFDGSFGELAMFICREKPGERIQNSWHAYVYNMEKAKISTAGSAASMRARIVSSLTVQLENMLDWLGGINLIVGEGELDIFKFSENFERRFVRLRHALTRLAERELDTTDQNVDLAKQCLSKLDELGRWQDDAYAWKYDI